jgi:hypothetical protein
MELTTQNRSAFCDGQQLFSFWKLVTILETVYIPFAYTPDISLDQCRID